MPFSHDHSLPGLPGLNRFKANGTLSGARTATNLALIGTPRGSFDATCRPPQNPDFLVHLETADLGIATVTGLRPAVQALAAILRDLARTAPAAHARLGVQSMLCCRLVRASACCISNHSWGLAVDLLIDGSADPWAVSDGAGVLRALHPVFRRHGFYWGAAYPRPEPLHFEASDQLVRRWAAQGVFGPQVARAALPGLTMGDRGPEVLTLQQALNAHLPVQTTEDGFFGPDTRAALCEFQRRHGMKPDGIAARAAMHALDILQVTGTAA